MYERAIGNVPLPLDAPEKRFWQRYIYLWVNYAIWEEMEAEDPARTREVYRNCLKLIPHQVFTFAKVHPAYPPGRPRPPCPHTQGAPEIRPCAPPGVWGVDSQQVRYAGCSRLVGGRAGVDHGSPVRDSAAQAGRSAADPRHGSGQLPEGQAVQGVHRR